MAVQLTPGLQALPDDPGKAQAFAGRPVTQGPQLDTPQLTPVASPVDTFIQAAHPSTNAQDLGRIADALSAFQPELQRFSQTQHALEQQQAQGTVPQLLAGQNASDMRQTLKSNPALQNTAASRLGMSMLGAQQANETFSEAQQAYSTSFDKEHGDFNQFVQGYIQRDLKANPDPFFAKSYAAHTGPMFESLRQHYTQEQAGFQKDSQDSLISGAVSSAITAGLTGNSTPAQVMSGLQTTFGTTKAISGRPYAEQQQLLLGELRKQAATLQTAPDYEKRFQMIQGLLNQDRGTHDGVAVGSLLDGPATKGLAATVLDQATRAYENQFEVQNADEMGKLISAAKSNDPSFPMLRQQFVEQHRMVSGGLLQKIDSYRDMADEAAQKKLAATQLSTQAQREQGDYINSNVIPALINGTAVGGLKPAMMHDTKGRPIEVPVDQQLKVGVAQVQSMLNRQYAGKENDPAAMAEKFQTEAHLYAVNGQVNPDWKRQLGAGYASALTAGASGEKSTLTPNLQQGYDLYKHLEAVSPAALNTHVTGNAERLYSMASAAEQAGMSSTQALQMAVKATQDKEFIKNLPSLSMTETHQDIHAALAAYNQGWNPFGSTLADVSNASEVEARVHEYASVLHYASGVPMDSAIKMSADKIGRQYQVINGTAVNVSGKGLPSNFGDLANGVIGNWWKDHGEAEAKEGHTQSDLTIHQLGNTPQWVMLYKSSMSPPSSPHASFGLPELHNYAVQNSNADTDANHKALGKAYDQGKIGQYLRDLTGGAAGPM